MVRQASCDVCDRNDKSSPDTAWQILGWRSRLLSWTPTSAQTPAPAPASKERRSTRSRETFAKSFAGSSLPPSFWDPSEPGCGSSPCPRRRRAQTLPGPPQAPGCPQAASVYPPEEGMEGTAPPPRSGAWHGPITAGVLHPINVPREGVLHLISAPRGGAGERSPSFLFPPRAPCFRGVVFHRCCLRNPVLLLRNYLRAAPRAKTKQASK